MLKYDLLTKYYPSLDSDILACHPNPLFERENYHSLNGIWNCSVIQGDDFPNKYEDNILVPFCIESFCSGQRFNLKPFDVLWYKKEMSFDDILDFDHIILHFDSIMQMSVIYINRQKVYESCQPYLPIVIDIKPYIKKGNNTIEVKVRNIPLPQFAQGKEGHKRGGMWYTKTTGIYKPVWIEWFNNGYIEYTCINASIDGKVEISLKSTSTDNSYIITNDGNTVASGTITAKTKLFIENPKLWDPDNPNLYYIEISNKNDKVKSYFAFRKFEIKGNKFYLNDKEIFINGVLDQGYYSDGIYTPCSYKAYEDDILEMKKLGFNALRKHIKTELDMYYYYADKLGILILQDFPNSGKYKFLTDTLLPTIGIRLSKKETNNTRILNFIEMGEKIVERLRNHPSVVYYTIFNEGWGEFNTETIYNHFKEKYPNEIFDSASGWFNQKKSDVLSLHKYFVLSKLPVLENKPVILSEYGGYVYKVDEHSFNTDKTYGYKILKTHKDYVEELKKLQAKIEDFKKSDLAGAIYTQLSDVEDETNGLLTYDRKINKINSI